MIPAKPIIVECPHCGGRKALLSLASWNTFGVTYWSDTKMAAMPRISPVQRCPVCGQYSFLSDMRDVGDAKNWCLYYQGLLPYHLLKEAASRLLPTQKAYNERAIRIELLWAYNDLYAFRKDAASEEEQQYMKENIECLKALTTDNILLCAELHRESNAFDDCIRLLESHRFEDVYDKQIAEKIVEKARMKDNIIFAWKWGDGDKLQEINIDESSFRAPVIKPEKESSYVEEDTERKKREYAVFDDTMQREVQKNNKRLWTNTICSVLSTNMKRVARMLCRRFVGDTNKKDLEVW